MATRKKEADVIWSSGVSLAFEIANVSYAGQAFVHIFVFLGVRLESNS
jgi:hypothetical protein